ncbi:hypothetical protein D9M68_985360 [compost metagenome]
MIDLIGDVVVELAQRVIGQLGQMHHRLKSLKVFFGDVPNVLADPLWRFFNGVVQPAISVEAGVDAHHVMTTLQ